MSGHGSHANHALIIVLVIEKPLCSLMDYMDICA